MQAACQGRNTQCEESKKTIRKTSPNIFDMVSGIDAEQPNSEAFQGRTVFLAFCAVGIYRTVV